MIDLTQPLSGDIARFPGDPEVHISPLPGFSPWQVSRLELGTHSGTHLDAPRHRLPEGPGIGSYGPDRLLGWGLVVEARGFGENEPVPADVLASARSMPWPGWFAVVRTGWDQYWGDERYFRHPFLSLALVELLIASGAALVAIDALSVDSTVEHSDAAHVTLLAADILIAENLCNLGALDTGRPYAFAFLPLSLGDADGSPARVVAWEPAHPAGC